MRGLDLTVPKADFQLRQALSSSLGFLLSPLSVVLPSLGIHEMNPTNSNQTHCLTDLYKGFILSVA